MTSTTAIPQIRHRRRLWTAVMAAMALVGSLLLAFPQPAQAANGNPAPHGTLSSTSATPALLLAGGAARSTGSISTVQADGHFWVRGFDTQNATLTWTVTSDATASYNIVGVLSSYAAVGVRIMSSATGQPTRTVDVTTKTFGWDKLNMGSITIPAGTSTLVFSRTSAGSSAMSVKGLELVPTAQQANYDAAVAASKRPASQWFSDAPFGLFFQYGAWGYPQTGPKKTPLAQACDFDVSSFVERVKKTGAAYVMWSYTWWTFQVSGSNAAIDRILGNPANNVNTLTGKVCPDGSSADVNRELAAALKAQGIRFILYYHNGHDQDANWWSKQNWPASFQQTGVGDRSTFFKNWTDVISEIGTQYGTDLDGIWFDDGHYYYPADFQELQKIARTGNPDRLVTYNQASGPAATRFQDFLSFDNCETLGPQEGWPVNSSGVITGGPQVDSRAHCQYLLNTDGLPGPAWGIHEQNSPISLLPGLTADSVYADLMTARADHKPLTFVPLMWEDGSWDPATEQLLREVGDRTRSTTCGTRCREFNDTASTVLSYSTGWSYSANRGAGDAGNDVHYAAANGSTATATFTGTGARFFMPTHTTGGAFTVTVDGVAKPGTFTAYAAGGTYSPKQQTLVVDGLTYGRHTVAVTKAGGTYLQLDAVQIDDCTGTTCVRLENESSAVSYAGSWGLSTGRTGGDSNNDVRYTTTNGDSATATFTGTAVHVYMPKAPQYGAFTVKVDGVAQPGNFTALSASGYQARQLVFSATGLSAGQHTITLTKTGGTWMQVDHIDYRP